MHAVVSQGPARRRRRRTWIAVAVAVGLALAVAQCRAAVAAVPAPGRVQDLDYGDVLFHFYQDDLFGALVRLEVAGDLGRMSHHAAEAQLLAGGLYLSLGMHLEATRIFDRLLAGDVPAPVNDRARFYLARIGYQRGYYAEAERHLAAIRAPLPEPLECGPFRDDDVHGGRPGPTPTAGRRIPAAARARGR